MRVPGDIGGRELAKALGRYGYEITRQTGSHIRLTTHMRGEHHVTVPAHRSVRIGALSSILSDVAEHLGLDKAQLVSDLWG